MIHIYKIFKRTSKAFFRYIVCNSQHWMIFATAFTHVKWVVDGDCKRIVWNLFPWMFQGCIYLTIIQGPWWTWCMEINYARALEVNKCQTFYFQPKFNHILCSLGWHTAMMPFYIFCAVKMIRGNTIPTSKSNLIQFKVDYSD